jgi:hypothetical protein
VHDCLAGRAGHRTYYRRLRRSVLADTFVGYQVARRFYRDVERALKVLEDPTVLQPLIQGYAAGRTLAQSIGKAGFLGVAARRLGGIRPRLL